MICGSEATSSTLKPSGTVNLARACSGLSGGREPWIVGEDEGVVSEQHVTGDEAAEQCQANNLSPKKHDRGGPKGGRER